MTKYLQHRVHSWFLSYRCTCMHLKMNKTWKGFITLISFILFFVLLSLWRLLWSAKTLPHWIHLWGFSLLYAHLCHWRSLCCAELLSHWLHSKWFYVEWELLCLLSLLWAANASPRSLYWKGFSAVCTLFWFFETGFLCSSRHTAVHIAIKQAIALQSKCSILNLSPTGDRSREKLLVPLPSNYFSYYPSLLKFFQGPCFRHQLLGSLSQIPQLWMTRGSNTEIRTQVMQGRRYNCIIYFKASAL